MEALGVITIKVACRCNLLFKWQNSDFMHKGGSGHSVTKNVTPTPAATGQRERGSGSWASTTASGYIANWIRKTHLDENQHHCHRKTSADTQKE